MKTVPHHDYRPDIDGLRTLAVLSVIIYHAKNSLLPSGFVGVDFFFVISGFLITRLIVQAIENGTFTFADFYARRIKRILPAYIVVAVATLLVASYLLIPYDYLFYTTSLAASFAFASNVFFSMLSWGYFGDRTSEFPLLHTWSLSVEEQFYFLFPILLLLLFRYARKYTLPALLMLSVVFIAISEYKVYELKSYFLITTRAHELIIGALTAFLSLRHPSPSGVAAEVTGIAGLGLMLASLFIFRDGDTYPGLNSLYPCLGTAMVIYAGQGKNIVSKVLANRLMVGIGLISYSLYLWHWPVFSFLKYRHIEMTLSVGLSAIALIFILSALTYRFVETPVRRNRTLQFKQAFFRIYAAPAAVFLSIGLYSYMTEGAPLRFPQETRELISSYSFERDLNHLCSVRPDEYRKVSLDYLNDHCAFGDMTEKKPAILLIGDSHADHFKHFVGELATNAHMRAVYQVQGSCIPVLHAKTHDLSEEADAVCKKRYADLLDLAGNFKYVVLGGYWSSEPQVDLGSALGEVVEKIVKSGATPVVFKDNPTHEPNLSQCVLYKHRGWVPGDTDCNIAVNYVAKANGTADKAIDLLQARYPQMLVIDPKLVMCKETKCLTSIANIALYKDSNHLNPKASQLLGSEYIARMSNPLASSHFERANAGIEETGKAFQQTAYQP